MKACIKEVSDKQVRHTWTGTEHLWASMNLAIKFSRLPQMICYGLWIYMWFSNHWSLKRLLWLCIRYPHFSLLSVGYSVKTTLYSFVSFLQMMWCLTTLPKERGVNARGSSWYSPFWKKLFCQAGRKCTETLQIKGGGQMGGSKGWETSYEQGFQLS